MTGFNKIVVCCLVVALLGVPKSAHAGSHLGQTDADLIEKVYETNSEITADFMKDSRIFLMENSNVNSFLCVEEMELHLLGVQDELNAAKVLISVSSALTNDDDVNKTSFWLQSSLNHLKETVSDLQNAAKKVARDCSGNSFVTVKAQAVFIFSEKALTQIDTIEKKL